MRFRAVLGITLAFFTAVIGSPSKSQTGPVQIDLTINFHGTELFGSSLSLDAFFSAGDTFFGLTILQSRQFDFGEGISNISRTFIIKDVPPCVGEGTCQVSMFFSGTTFNGVSGFPVIPFAADTILPSTAPAPFTQPLFPSGFFLLPIGFFLPGDPCFNGIVCYASGPLVAFDDPFVVGSWDITMGATPLPATLPLFASGLGALGLMGWRRGNGQSRIDLCCS